MIDGPSAGRPWTASAASCHLRRLAGEAGVRRRFAPHQLRHAHAIEMARDGVPLNIIQRQLGHTDLGVTSTYLQGIDNAEIVKYGARPQGADDAGERGAAALSWLVREGKSVEGSRSWLSREGGGRLAARDPRCVSPAGA